MALSGVLSYGQGGGGALATLDCGFDWQPGAMMGRCQLIGSRGELELENAYMSNEQQFQLTVNGQPRTLTPANGYSEMVRHFQRVARGEEAALYPPEDAVRQARVLDALLLSAREGRRVEV